MTQETQADYLNVVEVAALLRVDRNTIYAMLRDGRLPYTLVGRLVRIRRRDVDGLTIRGRERVAVLSPDREAQKGTDR